MKTVLIAGAGAAGLMAAKMLSSKGFSVVVLEAATVIGGRIRTLYDAAFSQPLEAGAEFVHGKLPVTLQLLEEAGIEYEPVMRKMVNIVNGRWHQQDALMEGWDELMRRLQSVQQDITVAAFLEQYFSQEQYAALRKAVQRFAEGYDLADIHKASVLALREEWMNDEEEQYHLPGGYGQLIRYLEQQCIAQGCNIYNSHVVKNVEWKHNNVHVTCANGSRFSANKLILTVSPGVLNTEEKEQGHIHFSPAIPQYLQAVQQLGFGAVIKLQLLFREAFWLHKFNDAGFFLSNESIPTWWTQADHEYPLLTGWLGGPVVNNYTQQDEEQLLNDAVHSLAGIFNMTADDVRGALLQTRIFNWCHEPFVRGAYSYATLNMQKTVQQLTTPLEHTIYFAGEAMYLGAHPGTVEAALVTGQQVAAYITNS